MNKYWHVMKIGMANTLVYRFNFIFRAGFSLIPLTATIFLWRTIYSQQSTQVGNYTLAAMISYYLMVTIVDTLTAVNEDDWQIAADIKDGNISQFLLKPMDYLAYRFCLFVAGKMIFAVIAIIPIGLFIFYWRAYFVGPADGAAMAGFIISVGLSALLQFFMSYMMALMSFWLLEISTLIFMLFALEYIAGGHLFPLNILPPAVENILNLTPFPYFLYFPVGVYLGQIKGDAMWRGVAVEAAWTVFFYGMARIVWAKGIRKYSAAGG